MTKNCYYLYWLRCYICTSQPKPTSSTIGRSTIEPNCPWLRPHRLCHWSLSLMLCLPLPIWISKTLIISSQSTLSCTSLSVTITPTNIFGSSFKFTQQTPFATCDSTPTTHTLLGISFSSDTMGRITHQNCKEITKASYSDDSKWGE